MKKFLLFLATAAAAISCNNDNLADVTPSTNGDSKQITVTLSSDETPSSRVNVEEDGDAYKVTWAAGDKVGAWSDDLYNNSEFNKFTIDDNSIDGANASFTGKVTNGSYASSIRFVHPYLENVYLTNKDNTHSGTKYYNAFKIDLSTIKAQADRGHMSSDTYMVSDEIDFGKTNSSTTLEQAAMKHIGAAADLMIKIKADYTGLLLTNVTLSTDNGFATAAEINLQKGVDDADFCEVKSTGDIIIEVPSFKSARQDSNGNYIFEVPFNILPTEFNSANITVAATFVSADGAKTYNGATTISGVTGVFARATRNTIQAAIAELTESEAPVETTWTVDADDFVGTSYAANNKDHIKDGIGYYSNQVMLSSQVMQWQKTNGYIYNTTPLTNISKIEIDIVSGSFIVYVGTSEHPTVTKITGNNGVYDIPAGYNYFTIKVASGLSKSESFTVTYAGGSTGGGTTEPEVKPEITALSPSTLTFDMAGDPLASTIAGNNLEGASFTHNCDGKNFYVEITDTTIGVMALTANPTEDITEVVTISVEGGNSMDLTLVHKVNESTGGDQGGSTGAVTTECDFFDFVAVMGLTSISSNDGAPVVDAEFDDFTITSAKGSASTPFRLWGSMTKGDIRSYKGNTVTVTAKNGKKITAIKFSNSTLSNPTTGTVSGTTWSGTADEVTVTLGRATNTYINITVE